MIVIMHRRGDSFYVNFSVCVNMKVTAYRKTLSVSFNSFKVLMVMYLYFVQNVCIKKYVYPTFGCAMPLPDLCYNSSNLIFVQTCKTHTQLIFEQNIFLYSILYVYIYIHYLIKLALRYDYV